MACAGHCRGGAKAPVRQLVPSVSCYSSGNVHRFASCSHVVFPLQQVGSFPTASTGQSFGGGYHHLWRIDGGASVSSVPSSSLQRVIVMRASQEAGISTLVVQEVEFVWKGQGSNILLSGDFLNWETQLPLEKSSDGWFVLKQKLAPGTYRYKFIVDGQWQHSPEYPTVSDNAGGFNNEITVSEEKNNSQASAKEANAEVPKVEASMPATTSEVPAAPKDPVSNSSPSPSPAPRPPAPKAAAAGGGKKAGKAVAKSLPATMEEDVIPQLSSFFAKEEGLLDVELVFVNNQLEGSFVKNEVAYNFWAFFPDGKVEGSRGFSLTSHGSPPSTIEPFLIDEKKINGDLIVFWITKRLYAQKLLSTN